jgi:hypothetical protein
VFCVKSCLLMLDFFSRNKKKKRKGGGGGLAYTPIDFLKKNKNITL